MAGLLTTRTILREMEAWKKALEQVDDTPVMEMVDNMAKKLIDSKWMTPESIVGCSVDELVATLGAAAGVRVIYGSAMGVAKGVIEGPRGSLGQARSSGGHQADQRVSAGGIQGGVRSKGGIPWSLAKELTRFRGRNASLARCGGFNRSPHSTGPL